MKSFERKLAVITGAGSGMGLELALQLVTMGCHVALCDILAGPLEEAKAACERVAAPATRVSVHHCDVSREPDVLALRDAVLSAHATDHLELLFNNAGIGGAGSFLEDDRAEWERTFAVCWFGVYFCTRAFMPLLIASTEACLVNTSSVNGFWACLGPQQPHTAYSTAKFAVKGFTEALITDLRVHAPHVKVYLVMPGHVGTSILINTRVVQGKPMPMDMSSAELMAMRKRLARRDSSMNEADDATLRANLERNMVAFRDHAPLSAAAAASMILDGIRAGTWRILVGQDAVKLDGLVREHPEQCYEPGFPISSAATSNRPKAR